MKISLIYKFKLITIIINDTIIYVSKLHSDWWAEHILTVNNKSFYSIVAWAITAYWQQWNDNVDIIWEDFGSGRTSHMTNDKSSVLNFCYVSSMNSEQNITVSKTNYYNAIYSFTYDKAIRFTICLHFKLITRTQEL